jgi:hypothetical protein
MAIMKICQRCRTKHPVDQKCPNKCYERNKKESTKIYDKFQRKNSDIYNSADWKKLTEICKNRFNGLCLWSLIIHKRPHPGSLSHHIIEINDDRSRALDIDNLVYLSDEAHREVHELYKNDKRNTQHRIYQAIKDFEELFKG